MELYSIIKNDGPKRDDVLFWKFTGEDFNTNTQLIVNPGEEALFVKDGQVHAVFTNGKYTLETNNYPFLSSLRNMMSGNVSAFNCKVYYARTADALNLVWGTPAPLQVRDPKWDISIRLRARGAYTIRISDVSKFLFKFIGNNVNLFTTNDFKEKFKSPFIQRISSVITQTLQNAQDEILVVKSDLYAFTEIIYPKLTPTLDEYGVSLVDFYLEALEIDDKDPSYAELQSIRNARNEKRVGALGDIDELNILGDNWQRVQARNILTNIASNEGTAGASVGLFAGAGMGMSAANMAGSGSNGIFSAMGQAPGQPQQPSPAPQAPEASMQQDTIACPSCNAQLGPNAKFCGECGSPVKRNCPNCACEVKAGMKFCGECGTKL